MLPIWSERCRPQLSPPDCLKKGASTLKLRADQPSSVNQSAERDNPSAETYLWHKACGGLFRLAQLGADPATTSLLGRLPMLVAAAPA
jgi:hypothetical protein